MMANRIVRNVIPVLGAIEAIVFRDFELRGRFSGCRMRGSQGEHGGDASGDQRLQDMFSFHLNGLRLILFIDVSGQCHAGRLTGTTGVTP
jgi:hypothetical protein